MNIFRMQRAGSEPDWHYLESDELCLLRAFTLTSILSSEGEADVNAPGEGHANAAITLKIEVFKRQRIAPLRNFGKISV